jgi:DNA polymerase-3 subunit alpha
MPDIDLDFTDRRRDEVINYVAEKYGRERVAQIITFGTMAARAVIRDVGRAMKLSYSYCDRLAKMIPFGLTLKECLEKVSEFRQFYETDEQAKELIDFSQKLEGCARHASTHACGVVISKGPLDEIVPLQHPTQNDKAIVTQYEMHSIEDLGLLKMDFLGLKNLTIIEDTLARIYKVQNKKINIEDVPLDDKRTYKLLQEAQTTGVFQLESSGIKRYLKELKPTKFEDIVAMVALYRPGPIQFIPEYIERKHKRRSIEYLHPKLKPILEDTQGICIFQEQLMQIARDLAGFSLAEADVLRKAVGKKIKSLLITQKEKFIKGMIKNDINEKVAQKIWDWVLPFARYGFNRAHSTAYAKIAYQTAYLKAHFPIEFMAALLTSEKADIERIAFLIEECKDIGIEVLPPDINESFRNFSVVPSQKKIRFGLLAIKNVGSNVVEAIIKERKKGKFKSFIDFISRIDSKDLNKKSLESLARTGAFDKFEERNKLLSNMEEILSFNRETRMAKINGQKSLFDCNANIPEPSFRLKDEKPALMSQKLLWEKELLGLYISSHPLEKFKNILSRKTLPLKDLKNGDFPYKIRVGGIISSIKKILTKKGQSMLFVKLEDLTGNVEIVVFPSIIERNPTAFQENKVVFVTGKLENWYSPPKIICEEVEEILEET